ncbi:hypothetical protein ACFHW2_22420 [Actinomadura sp. LOL_016]|uniref:hypothetical protein n=1 Tax=unclassified Actinomadura TaxID=2626254 RepID=UPI003A804E55
MTGGPRVEATGLTKRFGGHTAMDGVTFTVEPGRITGFLGPMPGSDTAEGVRSVLGILGYTAIVPAAVGTLATASEYRHRTADVTFLFAPRRGRVLAAKLLVHGTAGAGYGLVLASTAAAAFFGVAAAKGVDLGLPAATIALSQEMSTDPVRLLTPVAGTLVLLAYAALAAAAAVAAPMRRDMT